MTEPAPQYSIGLAISTIVAVGTVGVEIAVGHRGGWGDFLLFSALPEFIQSFGQRALLLAKPIAMSVVYSLLYAVLFRLPKVRVSIPALLSSATSIVMCLGHPVA